MSKTRDNALNAVWGGGNYYNAALAASPNRVFLPYVSLLYANLTVNYYNSFTTGGFLTILFRLTKIGKMSKISL